MRPVFSQRQPHVEDLSGVPREGEIFDGKYRIDGVLGVGGMAVVLAATHLHLDERVAIKLLLPQWTEDPQLVERFMREGRASIKVRSEHVVRVLDVAIVATLPYLVMEYLDGRDLDALVREGGPLPIATAVDYLLQACEAIAEAHVSGIIHRDLKPANLFLTHRADGSACVKVLDFGISKIVDATRITTESRTTMATAVMGSPHYMSPEQMQSSKSVDERSDIWSLGAVLHELIAGKPPFEAESITALCAHILQDAPPPLTQVRADVPPALEHAVLCCLEKDPSRRYTNVAELARALVGFGSPAAYASAETISRVVEGAIDTLGVPWSLPPQEQASVRPTASSILSDSAPYVAVRRPVAGYVIGTIGVLAVAAGVGWMMLRHTDALHAAEARLNAASLTAPTVTAPDTSSIPPVPRDVPTSIATTTAATAVVPAATTRAPEAAVAAAPPKAAVPHATPHATPARARPHRWHRPAAPLPNFPVPSDGTLPSTKVADDPYAAPASTGDTAPSASPPAAADPVPPDPNQLFEDRK